MALFVYLHELQHDLGEREVGHGVERAHGEGPELGVGEARVEQEERAEGVEAGAGLQQAVEGQHLRALGPVHAARQQRHGAQPHQVRAVPPQQRAVARTQLLEQPVRSHQLLHCLRDRLDLSIKTEKKKG